MTLHPLFPTVIYSNYIDEILRTELLNLCNQYTENTQSNLLGIKNFPSTLHETSEVSQEINNHPVVKKTFEVIKSHVKELLISRKQRYFEEDLKPYGFFSDMKKGSYLRKHAHKDCLFSGIIYLEIGDNVPPLVFHDPRPFTVFESSKYENIPVVPVDPQKGMILIWDHWLEHEVYQKENDNPRKSFTFNV